MSTTRCKHGNVISDTMGSFVCAECDPAGRIEELEVDNARLRVLIKQTPEYSDECPWCGAKFWKSIEAVHADDCPAFTPDGAVR